MVHAESMCSAHVHLLQGGWLAGEHDNVCSPIVDMHEAHTCSYNS